MHSTATAYVHNVPHTLIPIWLPVHTFSIRLRMYVGGGGAYLNGDNFQVVTVSNIICADWHLACFYLPAFVGQNKFTCNIRK